MGEHQETQEGPHCGPFWGALGMSPDRSMQLLAQLLWKAVVVAAPLLLALLLVGVLVSIFQVVTQIQEMSLTFIPKLIVAVVVLVVFGPWMLGQLMAYSTALIDGIPHSL
jgi:flagellar biosynthesis protein FliQ